MAASAWRPFWPVVVGTIVVLVAATIGGVAILRSTPTPGPSPTASVSTPPVPTRSPTPTPSPTPTTPSVTPTPSPTADPGTIGRCGAVPTNAMRELRGMWLATVRNLDWPSRGGLPEEKVKEEYRRWLDLAQRFNHNAIFVQVRPSGDAFWPSAYAPWARALTGRLAGSDPGWDPLAFLVAETHARGLEFHAWFNPYRGSDPASAKGAGTDLDKLAPNHPLRVHPDWAIAFPDSKGGRLYFDPGIPAARHYVEDAILEAVAKYDIDGVHFDDFFYPYPIAGEKFDDDASFARYGEGSSRAAWRRANVNTFVREMHDRIKELKPWVKFGISPFGIWKNSVKEGGAGTHGLESYDAIGVDSRRWVEKGWVDYIVPQLYWQIGFQRADYAVLQRWWVDLAKRTGVQLYIGEADFRVGEGGPWDDPDELSRHLALGRAAGVDGYLHFRAESVKADTLDAQSRYRTRFYARPALVGVMKQLPANPPPVPQGLVAVTSGGTVSLQWSASLGAARYAVYRVEGSGADLVGIVGGTSFTGPAGTYCVSGLDRVWNEGPVSAPATA